MEKIFAYNGAEPYIFISYAHKDQSLVYPVISKMQRDGFRIWFDEGIAPGSDWDDYIAEHIKGCGYFFAFMSANYLRSVNCMKEIKYALRCRKNHLIVYFENIELPAGLDMNLNSTQSIFKYQYTDEKDFYKKLYSTYEISCLSSDQQITQNDQSETQPEVTIIAFDPKTGRGNYRLSDGTYYEGKIIAGKFQGQGMHITQEHTYVGNFENGERSGHGTITYKNGDTFEGEFSNNKRNGHGVGRYGNGDVFEGEYKDDKRNGHGVIHYGRGDIYEGEFKNGWLNGYGTIKYKNHDYYKGYFGDGEPNGRGVLVFSNLSVFEGEFFNGTLSARGTLRMTNGTAIEGELKNGKFIPKK